MRRLLILLVLVLAGGAGAFAVWGPAARTEARLDYRTVPVERGAIVATVRATGTLNPVTTVLVGSQLSGQVVEILADYNDTVSENQLIARLASDQISARHDAAAAELRQAEADLAVRKARLARAEATRDRWKASLKDLDAQRQRVEAQLAEAKRNYERQQDLVERKVGTKIALDSAQTQFEVQTAALASSAAQIASAGAELTGLEADIALARADILSSEAVIAGKKAKLRDIAIDLARTEIRSPVAGVVVQKSVELGQTVAASLQAPTLFTIAQDLREIEISTNIDEADVGRIREGQRVTFTVNAYPGRQFEGRVKQRRLGAQNIQNVVIYTVIVSVRNDDLALLPGMTANVQIITDERRNALKVSNAALRWRPPGSGPARAEAQPEAAAAPDEPGAQPAGRGRGGNGRARAEQFVKLIDTEVQPTAEERQAILALLDEQRSQMQALAGEGLDRDAARERTRAIRRDIGRRIEALLAPERRERFRAVAAQLGAGGREGTGGTVAGRVYVTADGGVPKVVQLRLGATDGTFTEIVSGDVQEKAQVIVGGGPKAGTSAPSSSPFSRMRLF